jgi:hypothetical protein
MSLPETGRDQGLINPVIPLILILSCLESYRCVHDLCEFLCQCPHAGIA